MSLVRPAEPIPDDLTPQAYVTRVLVQLEADFRALALLALADWQALEIAEPELFAALGGLLRPSWGAWSFLLQSLRNARKAQLRSGAPHVRDRIDARMTLQAVLAVIDVNAPPDAVAAARPLSAILGDKAKLKRFGDVLVLPISLRNLIAHFPPTEDAEWLAMRAALSPLAQWHTTHGTEVLQARTEWPEPWFVTEDDVLWSFNGIERDRTPVYAAAGLRPRSMPDRAAEIMRALQTLLGRSEQREAGFHRLLARLAPAEIRGVVLGDFLVGEPVARGGFASVHVGRQLSTGRKVAIKLLHDGLGEDARIRFQQEASYLSRLKDPAIVGVISYGEDAWTVPRLVDLRETEWFAQLAKGAAVKTYMALEWIDGRTLDAVYRAAHVNKTEAPPPLDVLRQWFTDAARALAAVHATGLVHRDIKPGNLMVDDDGRIRLMDFGIARSEDENRTLLTSTGYTLGTPPYMAPEQLRARDADAEVGPQADIYALAATFYELATGVRLFLHDKESDERVKTRKLAGELPAAPRNLVKGLPWELETILLGGLEPDPVDRYKTATALVRDLERWASAEPLEYRRPSVARRLLLGYRRNRGVANVAIAAVAIVMAGTTFYIRNVREERANANAQWKRAEEEKSRAEREKARAELNLGESLVEQGRNELLNARWQDAAWHLVRGYELGAKDAGTRFMLAEVMRRAESLVFSIDDPGNHDQVMFSPDGARLVTSSTEAVTIWSARDGSRVCRMAPAAWVAQSTDGSTLMTGSESAVRIWDAHSCREIRMLSNGSSPTTIGTFSLSGDLAAAGHEDGSVLVWNFKTGALVATLPHPAQIWSLDFSRDGERLLTGAGDARARIWNVRAASPTVTVEVSRTVVTRKATFSPDGTRFVTAADAVDVWDAASGRRIAHTPFHDDKAVESLKVVRTVVFTPDGTKTISIMNKRVVVASAQTGNPVAVLTASDSLYALAVSPDGKRIAVSGAEMVVSLWDPIARVILDTYEQHRQAPQSLAFSPDGSRIASAADDSTVNVWDAASAPKGIRVLETRSVGQAVVDATRDVIVTLRREAWEPRAALVPNPTIGMPRSPCEPPYIQCGLPLESPEDLTALVSRLDGRAIAKLSGHTDVVLIASLSRDGTRILTGSQDGTARLWDASTGQQLAVLDGHEGYVLAVAMARDNSTIVTGDAAGTVHVWNGSGVLIARTKHHAQRIDAVAFSADGRKFATGSLDGTAAVWSSQTGQPVADLKSHVSHANALVFTPDGQRIVSAGGDSLGRISNTADGTSIVQLESHTSPIDSIVASPDGVRIASIETAAIKIWEVSSGRLVSTMKGFPSYPSAVAFTPDGALLVTGSRTSTGIRIWDVASGRHIHSVLGVADGLAGLACAADGSSVTVVGRDGRVVEIKLRLETRGPAELSTVLAQKVPEYPGRFVATPPADAK